MKFINLKKLLATFKNIKLSFQVSEIKKNQFRSIV